MLHKFCNTSLGVDLFSQSKEMYFFSLPRNLVLVIILPGGEQQVTRSSTHSGLKLFKYARLPLPFSDAGDTRYDLWSLPEGRFPNHTSSDRRGTAICSTTE